MSLSHIPTLLLVIGYPVYWLELYAFEHPTGHTTWLATVLFGVATAVLIYWNGRKGMPWREWGVDFRNGWVLIGGVLSLLVLGVTCYASLFPPHLAQEFDALNYHISIPRQHLIWGAFAHLPWSSADLYFLPIDYALAPFWLATELPNKWPQFVFALGLGAVVWRLASFFSTAVKGIGFWVVVALLGAHGLSIQLGTAMMDLINCYLFFAVLDSVRERKWGWAAVELAFFMFAKSFMPFLLIGAALGTWAVYRGWSCLAGASSTRWGFCDHAVSLTVKRPFWWMFAVAAIVIAGPFVMKSFQYAGTPLYPFLCGVTAPKLKTSAVCLKAEEIVQSKDSYGTARTLKDFVAHFWILAVPEKGVNNRFDYPLGLILPLILLPFAVFLFRTFQQHIFPILPAFCMIQWMLWWMGPQQSRFLFIPLVGMIITTLVALGKPSRVLKGALIMALALTLLSVVRAHKADWGRSAMEVLRAEDKALLTMAPSVPAGQMITLDRPDIAFAPFAVDVQGKDSLFVIDHKNVP